MSSCGDDLGWGGVEWSAQRDEALWSWGVLCSGWVARACVNCWDGAQGPTMRERDERFRWRECARYRVPYRIPVPRYANRFTGNYM